MDDIAIIMGETPGKIHVTAPEIPALEAAFEALNGIKTSGYWSFEERHEAAIREAAIREIGPETGPPSLNIPVPDLSSFIRIRELGSIFLRVRALADSLDGDATRGPAGAALRLVLDALQKAESAVAAYDAEQVSLVSGGVLDARALTAYLLRRAPIDSGTSADLELRTDLNLAAVAPPIEE